MTVNEKGHIGLLKVLLDLSSKNIYVYKSLDDYTPIDIVLMNKHGKLSRVQVKYKSKNSRGSYEIHCRSVINGKAVPINKDLIDLWAIYLSDIDRVVYISSETMKDRKSISIKDDFISEEIFKEDC